MPHGALFHWPAAPPLSVRPALSHSARLQPAPTAAAAGSGLSIPPPGLPVGPGSRGK